MYKVKFSISIPEHPTAFYELPIEADCLMESVEDVLRLVGEGISFSSIVEEE